MRLSSPCYLHGIEPSPSGKCRSWIRDGGRRNFFYQLISDAPRRLRVLLFILRLRHLLLFATHCGDAPGYRWTYEYQDSEGIDRSLRPGMRGRASYRFD